MPEENQVGQLIAELRKEKSLTQKQLAEQLGVTDKAVSKWERGAGYPDITLLSKLAAALGISTGELLNGVREPHPASPPEPERTVETALHYADRVSQRRRISLTRLALCVLTVSCALAVGICAICDFSLSGRFTWLVYPAASLLFGWLVAAPVLYFKSHRFAMGLCSVTLFLLPFLFVLSLTTGGWFLPLGAPVSLSSLAYVWLVFLTFQGSKGNKTSTAGAALLLIPLLNLSIDLSIWRYTGQWDINAWDGVSAVVCLILGLLLLNRGRRF